MKNDEPELLPVRVGMTLRQAEEVLISATMEHTGWKISRSAAMLGIDRSTLYDKIKRYGISREASLQPHDVWGPAWKPAARRTDNG